MQKLQVKSVCTFDLFAWRFMPPECYSNRHHSVSDLSVAVSHMVLEVHHPIAASGLQWHSRQKFLRPSLTRCFRAQRCWCSQDPAVRTGHLVRSPSCNHDFAALSSLTTTGSFHLRSQKSPPILWSQNLIGLIFTLVFQVESIFSQAFVLRPSQA